MILLALALAVAAALTGCGSAPSRLAEGPTDCWDEAQGAPCGQTHTPTPTTSSADFTGHGFRTEDGTYSCNSFSVGTLTCYDLMLRQNYLVVDGEPGIQHADIPPTTYWWDAIQANGGFQERHDEGGTLDTLYDGTTWERNGFRCTQKRLPYDEARAQGRTVLLCSTNGVDRLRVRRAGANV